jgi:hypothetical protein
MSGQEMSRRAAFKKLRDEHMGRIRASNADS